MRRAAPVLFFAAALALLQVTFRSRGLNDPGTFWHTRVGGIIVERGFMTTDPFTFAFEDRTWIPQQWLGEVIMHWLHALGGWDALLWACSAAFAAAFAMVFRRLMAGGMGWPLAAAVAGFAMVAAGFHFYLRPHVLTIVFMAVVTAILVDVDNNRKPIRHLLWLIPIHIIWTNLHGGMLGGLATFAMALACWILQFVFKAASPIDNTKHALYIIFIFIACMMTMFVNPIGWELQRTWFKLIGSGTLAEHVPEHSPMSLARGGDVAVLGFAVLYLIVLAGAGRPRLTWLIPIPWLIMSVTSIRNGPLFVAVAAVMIAEIWPQTVWYRRLRMSGEMLAIPPTPLTACDLKMMIVPATIVIAGFAIQHFQIPIPIIGSGWARHDPMYVPMDMAPQIRNIPHGSRIYNDPNFGGFLIWHTPGCKIFFDDRFELCGDQFLNDYVNVVYEEPRRFDDWQRQYGFQWAFVHKEKPAALIEHLRQHPDWVIVDEGSTTMLLRFSPRFPTPRTGSTR